MTTVEGRRGFVVDASVALKWVVPESGNAQALGLLAAQSTGAVRLHVPELWFAEVGNAFWARTHRAPPYRLAREKAASALAGLSALRLRCHLHASLAPVAYALACDAGITVYDALYLALAVREHAPLVTADLQLAAAARRIGLGEHVLSLPDTAAFLASPPPPA